MKDNTKKILIFNFFPPKPDGRTDGQTDISNYRVASLLILKKKYNKKYLKKLLKGKKI